jgi:hypothetical protein
MSTDRASTLQITKKPIRTTNGFDTKSMHFCWQNPSHNNQQHQALMTLNELLERVALLVSQGYGDLKATSYHIDGGFNEIHSVEVAEAMWSDDEIINFSVHNPEYD